MSEARSDLGKIMSTSALRNNGGEDIFVHRSSLVDGGMLVQGNPVQFEVTWNHQKGGIHGDGDTWASMANMASMAGMANMASMASIKFVKW